MIEVVRLGDFGTRNHALIVDKQMVAISERVTGRLLVDDVHVRAEGDHALHGGVFLVVDSELFQTNTVGVSAIRLLRPNLP